jgi:multidrug resistance efflux pump
MGGEDTSIVVDDDAVLVNVECGDSDDELRRQLALANEQLAELKSKLNDALLQLEQTKAQLERTEQHKAQDDKLVHNEGGKFGLVFMEPPLDLSWQR